MKAGIGVAAAAILTIGLVSGALAQGAPAPKRGGTVIITLGGDPPTVNPTLTSGVPDGTIGCLVYQGLVQTTPDYQFKPLLAKSWTISPDGKTYDFTLNKANWQDGKPFTSEDVKYSLMEVSAKYHPIFASAARTLDSIETPAPDRAIIHLKQPFGPFLLSLTCGWGGAILPAHVYRGTDPLRNPATTSQPMGTGAYKLAEWKHGDYIRMVRNPDYWEPGKPYLDEIVARIITQPSARTQALQAGEVDYINYYYFPVSDVKAIEANPKLKVVAAAAPSSLDYMLLNVSRGPLADKRVRQALMYATDRDFILRTAWLGAGLVGTMPFSSETKWATNPEVDYRKMYPFDSAKANALLDEAGMKRGADGMRFQLHLVYSTDESDHALVGAALKSLWRAVGVDVIQEAAERATVLKRVYLDRDFDATLNGYGGYGDPALGFSRAFLTSAIGKTFGNPSGYSNPTVDKLFDEGEHATGQEERGKFYKELQSILADELPVITLREKPMLDVATKRLDGNEDENNRTGWRNAWMAD